jgi:serine/threonine-protein kinase SRPK3
MWKIKKHQKSKKHVNVKEVSEIGEYSGKIIKHNDKTYILINKLGVGAYATVWMCYCVNKKELFAIKIFKQKEKKGGIKEIDIYEKLNKMHVRHTVRLHDSFEKDGKMCIVIDLMAGSLYDIIKKGATDDNSTFKTGFSIDFVITTLHFVLYTLSDLHNNGIIHGDIKPENILLFGRTKMHEEIIKSVINKTSVKKISECIKEICKKFVLNKKKKDSDSDDSDNDDTNNEENPDSESSETNKKETKSDMSSPPEKIILSDESDEDLISDNDTNTASELDSGSNSELEPEPELESNNKIVDHLKLPKVYILTPIITLSDMGSCVDVNGKKKPIGVQTKYYKSPEIILGLEYDTSCDVWALGCTIYELLTGNILFNPDDYDIDKKRCLLHHICASLGGIPKELIDKSPFKQSFFTDGYTLKENSSYDDDLYYENKWITLLECVTGNTIKKYLLLDLILDMLKIDPSRRISVNSALKHPLFYLYDNKY